MYDKPKHQNLSYNLKWKQLQKYLQIIQKKNCSFGKQIKDVYVDVGFF